VASLVPAAPSNQPNPGIRTAMRAASPSPGATASARGNGACARAWLAPQHNAATSIHDDVARFMTPADYSPIGPMPSIGAATGAESGLPISKQLASYDALPDE
jgi:hypothetical protein